MRRRDPLPRRGPRPPGAARPHAARLPRRSSWTTGRAMRPRRWRAASGPRSSASPSRIRCRRPRRARGRDGRASSRSSTVTARWIPRSCVPLLDEVAVGSGRPRRRSPTTESRAGCGPGTLAPAMPWSLWWLRRRLGMPLHDIAPMRVARREDLLALGVEDRRFGYPVELLQRATTAGWRFVERDIGYHPRAAAPGPRCPGSVLRHPARGSGLRPGAVVRPGRRPRRGQVPGRRAGSRPDSAARWGWSVPPSSRPPRCSTRGGLRRGVRRRHGATSPSTVTSPRARSPTSCSTPPQDWVVHPQRGEGLAERLVQRAHRRRRVLRAAVVQVGMDTPQLAADALLDAADLLLEGPDDAVLGPAHDGGWWLLGVGRAAPAQAPGRGAHVHADDG